MVNGLYSLWFYKHIKVRIESAPTIVAAFPLDKQVIRAVDLSDFIGACGGIPLSKHKPVGPFLTVPAAYGFVSIKTDAFTVWQKFDFFKIQIRTAGDVFWIKIILIQDESHRFPFSLDVRVVTKGKGDIVLAAMSFAV